MVGPAALAKIAHFGSARAAALRHNVKVRAHAGSCFDSFAIPHHGAGAPAHPCRGSTERPRRSGFPIAS
jgi:hypothetical protein